MTVLCVLVVTCHSGAGTELTHGPHSGAVDQLIPAVLGAAQKKKQHRYASAQKCMLFGLCLYVLFLK